VTDAHDLPTVDRITVGTVGPTGKRTFLLQAREGTELVTLKVEKQQVAALSEYLGSLLRDLPDPGPLPADDELELEEPLEPEWAVGTLGLSYDDDSDRVIMVAEEAVPEDEEPAMARFGATREQVAALAVRGAQLVASGRPPCPLCGYPLDPSGHTCPKTNGHRPPAT
jgi:uncharacterized repeat protein (TIGR03847 family)